MDSMVGGKISIYDTRCFLHLLDLPGRTNLETRERHPSLAKMVDRMVAEIGFNLHSYGNTIGNPYLRSDEKLKPLFELYQRVSKENNILLINLLL